MAKPPKAKKPPEFTLTRDQAKVFKLVEETSHNVAVLGKPGTGKSVLSRSLDNNGTKKYQKAAPTGLAAINIDGKTIHSTFRIPISEGIIDETYNVFDLGEDAVAWLRYHCKHLIIDEISMVRADQLDYIDRCMQWVRRNKKPFGGTQVIAVGDFFQLPPVTSPYEERQLLKAGYKSPFAFHAKCWKTFKAVQLSGVLRQKGDMEFIKLLHNARTGEVTPKQMVLLNKQVGANKDVLRPNLTATNKEADRINMAELGKIKEPTFEFDALEFGNWPDYPVEKELDLKVGALVMVRKNGADIPPGDVKGFKSVVVNGTMGTVVAIHKQVEEDERPDCVTIRDNKGAEHKIYTARWERKIKQVDDDGEWEEKVIASYEQMPLSLAWAISMHKSQGQTFDYVHINAAKVFAAGQLYVALSRCKSLKGVSLESRINREAFWADKHVLKYHKTI